MSAWGTRAFDFAVAIILQSLWKSSIVFVSLYGIGRSLVAVIFGGKLGAIVDKSKSRVATASLAYVTQNVAFSVASIGLVFGIIHSRSLTQPDT